MPIKFLLGRIVGTPGALDLLNRSGVAPLDLLTRHASGDWGEVCGADRKENEKSLKNGWRIMSVYSVGPEGGKEKVWIITEADRSATTILLPSEY